MSDEMKNNDLDALLADGRAELEKDGPVLFEPELPAEYADTSFSVHIGNGQATVSYGMEINN